MKRQYVKVWVLNNDGWKLFCGRMYLPHAMEYKVGDDCIVDLVATE